MPRALFSVSDKTKIVEFAQVLVELGWDLIASGGTATALQNAGLTVTPVEIVTKEAEMLGGRVKTLHPAIHAGILARDTAQDTAELQERGYAPIDMVVCNLYPFSETVQKQGITIDEAIEKIDIGGVTLLRAAAKNYARVTVLCYPDDYSQVSTQLQTTGTIKAEFRQTLAVKAFAHTRDYDTAIHAYLQQEAESSNPEETLPTSLSLSLTKTTTLRYGENPHQQAGFYTTLKDGLPLGGELLGGKPLSYNNLLDLHAAWRTAEAFDDPAVAIIKHQTPTGIAIANSIVQAFSPALASDQVSAFGGVIAVNRTVDEAFVDELGDLFIEAIAAPEFTPAAQEILQTIRKNCRQVKMLPEQQIGEGWQLRKIRGGYLAQTADQGDPAAMTWKVVTKWKPSPVEMDTLKFAWHCIRFVPSNAILLAVSGATIGVGGGLPSRVDAARLAIQKAGSKAQGAVLASDAFFPFPDAIELAAQAGITAIVQPGGSIRDAKIIAAADDAGIAMIFTGVRHFLH